MIIIFEGPDKVGKSTLLKAVAKARNYKDVYVDRMFVSDIIYNEKFNRRNNKFLEQMQVFLKYCNPLYIFITAEIPDLKLAFKKRKEKLPLDSELVGDLIRFGSFYNSLLYKNKYILNRTNRSIDDCVKEIIKVIEKHEKSL